MRKNKYRVFLTLLLACSAFAAEAEEVQLSWKQVPTVEQYQIQISPQKDFSSLTIDRVVSQNEWTWQVHRSELPYANYYFRVASISSSGKKGAFSTPKKINWPETYSPHDPQEPLDRTVTKMVPPDSKPVSISRPRNRLSFEGGGMFNVGSMIQIGPSDQSLALVRGNGAVFGEYIEAALQWNSSHRQILSTDLNFTIRSFHTSRSDVLFDFGNLHSVQSNLQLLTEVTPQSLQERLKIEIGGVFDLSTAFQEPSPQVLRLSYGASVGPSTRLTVHFGPKSVWIPKKIKIFFEAPVLGPIWTHQLKIEVGGKVDWTFFEKKSWKIGISVSGKTSVSRWFSSQQTVFDWSTVVFPTFQWNG